MFFPLAELANHTVADGMLANIGIPLLVAAISLGWFTVIPVAILEVVIAKVLLRWPFFFAVRWVTLAKLFTMSPQLRIPRGSVDRGDDLAFAVIAHLRGLY